VFCGHCGHATSSAKIVAPRIDAPEEPVSERKFVTILRADLVQSTDLIAELDPEQAVSRLEPAIAAMRSAVRQFGGIVSKETGDGLSAVFGAPLANDNHAPLACHAAIELVRRVAGVGDPALQVRVGLHSGSVVAYMIASEFSKVYELGGAAQHLAVRLESAAETGEIYASEATQRLSEGHVHFDYLGLKRLKGFANPVPVYRVASASDMSSWRVRKARDVSPFVGRSSELAFLKRAAENALKSGQIVCLLDGPGIGKSRLAHEFVQTLEAEGWKVIEAECSPNLQSAPFAALKNLLVSVLGPYVLKGQPSDPNDPRAGLPQILRSALDAVLDLPLSDPHWEVLSPSQRGRAICDASRAIIENVARGQRTVLLIEDLHWIDSSSTAAIESLTSLTGAHQLLVLVSSRPEGAPEWLSRCSAEELWLRPLDDHASRAILDAIVGPSASTADLKSRIIHHTGNVPLFIEEVCRQLRETGVVEGQWGSLTLRGDADGLGVPPTVQGVIAGRIDRLPKEERALLQIAAAIGPRPTVIALRDVAALPEPAFQSRLASLDRVELLIQSDSAPEPSFEFAHDLIRQVTYDSMLEVMREGLHKRILAALEARTDQHPDDRSDILCHHATRAKDWPKALAYGRSVARKCLARSAFSDATSYFETAMAALDHTPMSREREAEAIDLRIEARIAFMGFGQIDRWLDLGREAEQRADQIGDSDRKVAAMTVRAAALNFHGTPLEAIEAGEQVVSQAKRSADPGWLSLAEFGLGQAYCMAGRCREAERMIGRACERLMGPAPAAPIGTTTQALLLICCMFKTVAHAALGEFDAAELFQRRAQVIADESGRAFDRVAAAYSRAIILLGRADPAPALTVLDEALALAEEHELRLWLPMIESQLGIGYLEEGRVEAATKVLSDACEAADRVGFTSARLRASIHLALARCQSGETGAALQMLRGARNIARQQGFEGVEAEALFSEAKVMAMTPRSDAAEIIACLNASIAIAERNEAAPHVAKAKALLALANIQARPSR
jgi:class 3 adenylate cyclase/tetratricopeptide (TPR) repeat protein